MAKKSIWAFVSALRADLFAAMSGGFSVPFGALAVFSDQKYQQAIWGSLALGAFCFASYRLWKAQYDKAALLEAKLSVANQEEESKRDVGLNEAIGYVCFREWGKRFMDVAASSEVSATKDYDEFLQALADGPIPIWGKKDKGHVYEPVHKTHWFNNRIEWFQLLKGTANSEPAIGVLGDEPRYFSLMTSREAVEKYWPAIGATGSRAQSFLKITFGMGEGYSETEGLLNLSQYQRILSFKLENRGPRAVSNCRAVIEATENNSVPDSQAVLLEGKVLAPGEHVFVPLLSYGEPFDGRGSGDSFVCVANAGQRPIFDVCENILISLRATGIDTPPLRRKCRAWVNEEKRLQIANEW